MNRAYPILLSLALGFRTFAVTTNIIDIAALATCGTGTTNGWTISGIDSYADKISIRINNSSEYVLSPEFTCAIREIILYVKSSSKNGPILAFTPYINGQFNPANEIPCAYSPNKDSYVQQSISFGDSPQLSGVSPRPTSFKISYSDGCDGNIGWGISYLAVITDDTPILSTPKNIRIAKLRSTDATIQWDNDSTTTSNLLTVFRLNHIHESYNTIADYDFDLCYGHGTSGNIDQSSGFHELYPEFTAEKVYYPLATTGIVQMSTTKANGRLTFQGLDNYFDTALKLSVYRPDNDKSSRLYAYYIDESHQTNVIGAISISSTLTTSIIPLSGTPEKTAIHLGNLDGFKSDRRYLIDRISFLADYRPECIETNYATSVTTTGSAITIRGLSRRTEYQVRITAFDSAGNHSDPSAPLSFATRARDPGFIATLR